MKKSSPSFPALLLCLAMLVSACNLSRPGLATPPAAPATTPVPTGAASTLPPAAAQPATQLPTAVTYLSKPADPLTVVASTSDAIFPSSSGDAFSINQFERPFQLDNTYRPDADIKFTFIADDGEWYYFSTQVVDVHPGTKMLDASYMIEIDVDRDGRGDFLLLATPPYASDWTKANVQIWADKNHDVGGPRPLHSDAPWKGDGYETLVFDRGTGSDPDAAWTRQDPKDPTYMQIAVKQATIGAKDFLWSAWTDFDLVQPGLFDYNDFITAAEAGSPYAADPNYPLKKLYGMDNTCRVAYGFTPTGSEPGLCGGVTPAASPTRKPAVPQSPTNTPVPPPPAQPGSINGLVFIDNNGDGALNSGDAGTNSYPLYLFANNSCSGSSISSTTPDSSGNYSFPNLAAGTYCLDLFYSGSPVLPGNPQVVNVSNGTTTTINFAIEPPG